MSSLLTELRGPARDPARDPAKDPAKHHDPTRHRGLASWDVFAAWFDVPATTGPAMSGPATPGLAAGQGAPRGWDVFVAFAGLDRVRPMLSTLLFDAAWYAAAHHLPRKGERAALAHYLTVGVRERHDPTPWFSEAFYCGADPELVAGIAAGIWRCGYHHYLARGMAEQRSPSAAFNERAYLAAHPDVGEAVRRRELPSGLLHYLALGRAEGRRTERAVPAAPAGIIEAGATDAGVIVAGVMERVVLPAGGQADRGELFRPPFRALADWFEDVPAGLAPAAAQALRVLAGFAASGRAGPLLPGLLFDPGWYAVAHDLPGRSDHVAATAFEHYLKIGVAAGHDPTGWFSEAFYRAVYADVRAAIAGGRFRCGYQHYLVQGMAEHRSPNERFSEVGYLGTHADVLDAMRAGRVPSGFLHYAATGREEGRVVKLPAAAPRLALPAIRDPGQVAPSASFAEALYLSANGDVRVDGAPMPGLRHWLSAGLGEDLRGVRARIPGYSEAVYLRHNSDIAGVVRSGGQPSGYHHFLMYGAVEQRRWSGSDRARLEARHLARALGTRTPAPRCEGASPLISLIVPVFNPEPAALAACIQSVRDQGVADWELCLADDGSHRPDTLGILLAAQRADARIRLVLADRNSGIAAASNLALATAGAPFVALLDHDDVLAPDALLHLSRAVGSAPDVDMVYTDEAKLAEDGTPTELNPKPGWSPELLLSTMYIGHLTAYRRALVEQVGGFRPAFDGTQDYELALRVSEVARRVVHVPLPLYFWRKSPASTAGSLAAKPHVLERQRQALESALIRRRQRGTVQPGHGAGHWTVTLDVPEDMPLVSIVIPSAGRMATVGGVVVDLLVNCIQSIAASETYPNTEFVVVHNDDLRPETLAGLASVPRLRLVRYVSETFNISDKINLGVEAAAGRYVLLLNDDMQAASKGIIRSMLGRMFDGVGIVGGRLLYANGTLQHAGVVWSEEGPSHAMIGEHRLTAGPSERLRIMHNCLAVSGACMFFRRDVFQACGGFPPRLPLNYNDVELCLRVQAQGLRIVFNPDVTLYHFESQSKTGTRFWELQQLLLAWPALSDPYWNPTFSRRSPFYELRDPDRAESPSYRGWLMQRIARRQAGLTEARRIRFSLITSVYQTRRDQLEELEATVFHQTYDNWEWVIVDNGSTEPGTLAWLAHIRGREQVRFTRLANNIGIMGGTGTAFRAATGDYVVPVDSDDFLTLDCLHVLATALEAAGHPDAVYSDEDKSDEQGMTHSPFFKPDWDPVLFTNICYVCHVCAIKRSTARAVNAYTDQAASWCHDWDSFLRLQRAGARILHVPEPLYSWRIHPGSTASAATSAKPGTIVSQRHVLDQHLRLTGQDRAFSVVENELFPHDGMWRLKPNPRALPPSAILLIASPDVHRMSALLLDLAWDMEPGDMLLVVGAAEQFGAALERVPAEFHQRLGLADDSPEPCLTLSDALARCENAGREIVAVVDAGVARLNRSWLREGVGMFAAAADVGAVGGQILMEDGRVAWRGGFRGFGGMAGSPDYGRMQSDSGYHGMGWCQRSCDAVPSLCFFARIGVLKQAASALGDRRVAPRELAGQVAATVWQAGLRIVYTPFVQATLGHDVAVHPIVPDGALAASRHLPDYYPAVFGATQEQAYSLAPPSVEPFAP